MCGLRMIAGQKATIGFCAVVSALRRAHAVKAFGPQKYRRPALPGRDHILRFEQVEQMALGRENVSVTGTNGGANIFGLAGFLRNDNLIRHDGSFGMALLN